MSALEQRAMFGTMKILQPCFHGIKFTSPRESKPLLLRSIRLRGGRIPVTVHIKTSKGKLLQSVALGPKETFSVILSPPGILLEADERLIFESEGVDADSCFDIDCVTFTDFSFDESAVATSQEVQKQEEKVNWRIRRVVDAAHG